MLIIWLCVNTLMAALFGFMVMINPLLLSPMNKGSGNVSDRLSHILLASHLAAHTAVAVALSLLVTVRVAVAVTSVIALVWSLTAYFLLQRFADLFERPGMVKRYPVLYPTTTFAAFVACCVAMVMFAGWVWAVVPPLLWFLLGFGCAELAIRRQISRDRKAGMDCDRRLAVFAVNDAQGRRGIDRYPFP